MDILTLLILLIIGHSMILLLTYGSYLNNQNYLFKLTLIAQILFVLAYIALYLRGIYASIFLIIVANSLLIAAMALQACAQLYAIHMWNHKVRKYYIVGLLVQMLVFYAYVLTYNSESIRIALISITTASIVIYPAICLFLNHKGSIIRKIMGGALWISVFGFVMRIGGVFYNTENASFLNSQITNVFGFLMLYAFMILNGLGLLLLIKEEDDKALVFAATYDRLTGIFNRSSLIDCSSKEIDMHMRKGHEMSLMVIDIDHFKRVNDEHGHAAGDEVLASLASSIRENLRPYDIFGRIGGEEFVIVLPETGTEDALCIAERIRSLFDQKPLAGINITISIGLWAGIPEEKADFESLFKYADLALYKAKANGRNKVERLI